MQRKTIIATLSAVMLSIVPLAAGEWMVAGTFEPNTAYDTPQWMWKDPPLPGQKRVYFNVITQGSEFLVTGLTYNPNVALLRTQNDPATGEFHEAVLGLWADCNGDGYIGNVETALREYPSELLPPGSACQARTGSIQTWTFEGGHNYNGIVSELIPIGRDPGVRDTRVIRDHVAKVWGDFERPDEKQKTRRCALDPQPRGTFQSTGGLLAYLDCRAPLLENFNDAADIVGAPATGLKFADEDDAFSGPLGQQATFGSDDDSHAAVHTADCGAPYLARSGDVLNQTALGPATQNAGGQGGLHNFEVRPAPSNPVNTNVGSWTAPGQMNATLEETTGDCDTSNDRGADFYETLGEGDNPQIDPKNKKGANWNFFFATSNRGGAPVSVIKGGNAGMNENDAGTGWGGSRWIADSLWGSKPGFGVVKADLGTQQVGPADAYWLTFYATVGSNTTSKGIALPGGSAAYGAWACGSFTSGIHNGWNCDVRTWYKNPDGSDLNGFREVENHEFARLGQPYHLRDVDCYDGSNDLGVPLQPAALGTNRC